MFLVNLHKMKERTMAKNKLIKDNYFEVETVDTGPTCFLEEDVYVPEEFVRGSLLPAACHFSP